MNVDRRANARVCIALLVESDKKGTMEEDSYVALQTAVSTMRNNEYWQLRNQTRFEGSNVATDEQIAISKVALPALEAADAELKLDEPDFQLVIEKLTLAVETDGKPRRATPRGRRKR